MKKLKEILKVMGKVILRLFKRIYSVIEKVTENPIIVGILLLIIFGYLVIISTIKRGKSYEGPFLDNILVEAHGLLFDIFVFAILIAIFNRLGEKRRDIKRYKEEIDDYREWDEKEATFRIAGNIRRLSKLGVSNLDLFGCYLAGVELENINLKDSILYRAHLKEARLISTNLSGANLCRANLIGTELWGANLSRANLQNALLNSAILLSADLNGADLSEANLYAVNLRGAKNLTLKQLSKVKTLYNARLDPELLEQVKGKYPHLLEKPAKDGKE